MNILIIGAGLGAACHLNKLGHTSFMQGVEVVERILHGVPEPTINGAVV